jgi:radical SAM superfamily enzyme YgiQ (UPF0313 family)
MVRMQVVLLNIFPQEVKERRYDMPHYPNPSLCALASYLFQHGINCRAVDCKLERLSLTRLIERLKGFHPSLIGFTSFTHEIEMVASAARSIKQYFPKAKLIIGGPHANALPKEVLAEFPVFDIAVFGEGEETLLELVKNCGEHLEMVRGIAYRKGSDIILNDKREFLSPDKLPKACWIDFPKAVFYPVFTTRGCAYKCVFCSNPWGQKVRYRPIEDIIEEITHLSQLYRPRLIYFWDENFCSDRGRVVNLLKEMKKNEFTKKLKWFCQVHINDLDYELLSFMKASGCIKLGIGIESGSDQVLGKIGKGITKEKIRRVVGWLKKLGIPYEGYFLFGLPDECWESAMETVKFAAELNPKYPVFGIVVPYPNTKVFAMANCGEGGYRIISHRWQDYNKIIGGALELNTLSRKQLELLQLYGYTSVLIKNLRFFDSLWFIFQYYRDIISYTANLLFSRTGRQSAAYH